NVEARATTYITARRSHWRHKRSGETLSSARNWDVHSRCDDGAVGDRAAGNAYPVDDAHGPRVWADLLLPKLPRMRTQIEKLPHAHLATRDLQKEPPLAASLNRHRLLATNVGSVKCLMQRRLPTQTQSRSAIEKCAGCFQVTSLSGERTSIHTATSILCLPSSADLIARC
ncbi:hypothetical protein HK405_003524, partial [Cladochytrium tenue]